MDSGKYSLSHAARPFSLVVALVNGGLAVSLAWADGRLDPLPAWLVMLGALVLQLGVNLINDYGDLSTIPDAGARSRILRNCRWGGLCFALAFVAGCYLVALNGWPLLLILGVGLVGALGYTLEPLNYKRRGLALPLVFLLMGVLIVAGGYLSIAHHWPPVRVWWLSVPVSLLTALLLLSNELRDYHQDRGAGVLTLTVRRGIAFGRLLFLGLALAPYLFSLGFWLVDWLTPLPLLLPLLLLPGLLTAPGDPERIARLPPLTGRYFLVFGAAYILSLPGLFN